MNLWRKSLSLQEKSNKQRLKERQDIEESPCGDKLMIILFFLKNDTV